MKYEDEAPETIDLPPFILHTSPFILYFGLRNSPTYLRLSRA